jgi:D-citramalate synthase
VCAEDKWQNALVSVAAGADLVHTTVNGIGKRTDNVALEEVALDHGYDVETVATERLYDLAQTVATATGSPTTRTNIYSGTDQ